ncbi:hypothetical protein D3C71_2030660 [compost metagenome]
MRNKQINIFLAESSLGQNTFCGCTHYTYGELEHFTAVHINEVLLVFNSLGGCRQA